MSTLALNPDVAGVSPYVLGVREAFESRSKSITRFPLGDLDVELRASHDSVWAFIRRKGHGGLALRAAYLTGEFSWSEAGRKADEIVNLKIRSVLGEHVITFSGGKQSLEQLRVTVRFTPAVPMLVPFMPRDLYPLDNNDDPLRVKGNVEAGQRGLNSGLQYLRIDEPRFGTVLYFQNLTSMNEYYRATKTKPDGAVGGVWPELGYLIPTPAQSGTPPTDPLKGGVEVTLSDAFLVFSPKSAAHERESALLFLHMLGVVYRLIDRPECDYRDWVDRAERTLRDLDEAPEATIKHYGHRYIHPYTGAEYPDIMVQMSVIEAIHEWGKWCGEQHPLEAEFKAGLEKFYDPKLKSLRRYLPNVGDDKDADAVDSWYLYHPMTKLAALALDGEEQARDLLMKSIDFGIKAAHHFKYKWPIQYKITDFSVITESAESDGRGQTDVGGIYAWVMLQAYELTEDKRFLDEARAAIDAAAGLRFGLNYQANLTAWGAAACLRLWRVTNERIYLEQSYVYIASFFHNAAIWESEIEYAADYRNFLGVTCLQDAPYMAIYECFDSLAAFERYLDDGGRDIDPAVRMLMLEYCKYALDRAWYYYPDALPAKALSPKQREANGHIDRKLSFPVEDLYVDGQPAGQVGQEIYGAGAAFIFATRGTHLVDGAPFRIYCDQILPTLERTGQRSMTLTLHDGAVCTATLSIVRLKRHKLGAVKLTAINGDVLEPRHSSADRISYELSADGRYFLTWE
jgi:hypothetical protein